MRKSKYIINNQYGQLVLLEKIRENNLTIYRCLCKNCNEESFIVSSDIKSGMCSKCRNKKDKENRSSKAYDGMIGKTYGNTTVLEIYMGEHPNIPQKHITLALCRCELCGQNFTTIAARVKSMKAQSCVECNRKNLSKGYEFSVIGNEENTQIVSLVGRNPNDNNSTGVKGVGKFKNGTYRAYINFKRKQYHLGIYKNIEDAAEARKQAEEKIYGEFLDWYKNEYPEQWAKIDPIIRAKTDD